MNIIGIHHVSLIVQDTDSALSFYQDLLGLSLDEGRPELDFPGAWLEVGYQQQIHLLELDNPYADAELPEHGGRDRHAAFMVDNLDELVSRLDAAGVAYRLSRSGRKALFCRDPDGNTLEFIQAHQGPR